MINNILINDYKCLHKENVEFKPLTIITGQNSTGKSSLIQAILLPAYLNGTKSSFLFPDIINLKFDIIRNKYKNSKELNIEIRDNGSFSYIKGGYDEKNEPFLRLENPDKYNRELEKNLYYLSANRLGAQQNVKINPFLKIGVNGDYIFATFEEEKSNPLFDKLIKDNSSFTLSTQLNYWLSYITGIRTELSTEKKIDDFVEVKFKSDDISNISPFQLGAGVSYLTKIIILCLRAKEGDLIIIENPEIHLHPAAQSKLGEFFTFIANAGIQIIIETHCEHLIHKVGYQIFKNQFHHNNAVIYYKGATQTPFEKIEFKKNGLFSKDFPDGFFDASLYGLLEMEE